MLFLSFLLSSSAAFATEDTQPSIDKASLPSSYDLRDENRLPPLRYHGGRVAGWDLAALGSLESSAITQGLANANTIDLSEMYLAYFLYGDNRPGKSFKLRDKKLDILFQGVSHSRFSEYPGLPKPVAFLSRQGAVNEADVQPFPYCLDPSNCAYTPPAGNADDYAPALHLQRAYSFSGATNEYARTYVKEWIRDYGAVATWFEFDPNSIYHPGSNVVTYFNPNAAAKSDMIYFDVLLVGWDNNFPRENFGASEDKWPQKNGAWLVRGLPSNAASQTDGLYWVSYEQNIYDSTMYIAKAADNLRHYGHDDLGHTYQLNNTNYQWDAWAANVFQAQSNETVREVAFTTVISSAQCEIFVYDLGTTAPSSPVAGKLLTQQNCNASHRGYYRDALKSPADVNAGHYFSVVVKMKASNIYPIAVERSTADAEPVVNAGESWFSKNGTSWQDGVTMTTERSGLSAPSNATIKAFTSAQGVPVITTNTLPKATVGQPYSTTLDASGTKPITWKGSILTTNLPISLQNIGLNLSSDGRITGTPTQAGTFTIVVTATNSKGSTNKTVKLTIEEGAAAPTIKTSSLPAGKLKTAYSATLTASGATPITWTKASGTLPGGLALSNGGVISGTPTKEGIFGFTVKAENSKGSATKELSIKVGDTVPVITTTSLPGAIVGKSYSATLTATGMKTIKWTAKGLPEGLKLSDKGKLSGKPKTQGEYSITVTAKNDVGEDTKKFVLSVGAKPVIKTTSLPGGIAGERYNQKLETSQGTGVIKWKLDSGKLPDGLKLTEDGFITGTPLKNGKYSFKVKASNAQGDATKSLKIAIMEPPSIMTTSLPTAFVGKSYSFTLKAEGTKTNNWESTRLPAWMKLSSTGKLSGTPKEEGTSTVTVTAKNDVGKVTKTWNIAVEAKPVKPKITTTSLPSGEAGVFYKQVLTASGTPANIKWTKAGGTLPDGLNLASDGTISGTPKANGKYSFKVKAENSQGNATKSFKIEIAQRPSIKTTSLPGAVVGKSYKFTLEAEGTKTIKWTAKDLPAGVTLSTSGKLGGKPKAGGKHTFTVTAKNNIGEATQTLTLEVGEAPTITTNSTLYVDWDVVKSVQLSATGSGSITWAVTKGSLPNTWRLSKDGKLSGEALSTNNGGKSYSFTVEAKNNFGATTQKFTMYIGNKPVISTTTLPDAELKQSYTANLNIKSDYAITAEIAAGSLPKGVKLAKKTVAKLVYWQLTGKPTETGTFKFTVKAKNAIGESQKQLTLTVK